MSNSGKSVAPVADDRAPTSADVRFVNDVWLAFSRFWQSLKHFLLLFLLPLLVALYFAHSAPSLQQHLYLYNHVYFLLAVLAYLSLALVVFVNYLRGVRFDASAQTISFPASDIENSLLDILIAKPVWGHLWRETISLEEIEGFFCDTAVRGSKRRWRLNLTGTFGSRQLEFTSKQKRDECRSALRATRRGGTSHLSHDWNTDLHESGGDGD